MAGSSFRVGYSHGFCEDAGRGTGKTTWLRCLVAVPSLRKDMISDVIEWIPAVVQFGVTFIEPSGAGKVPSPLL